MKVNFHPLFIFHWHMHNNTAAATGITYIGNQGHHHYLALVTDAYSKKIVGYDLSQSLAAEVDIYNNLRPHFSCALLTPTLIHHQAERPRATYHKKIRSKQMLAPNNRNTIFV